MQPSRTPPGVTRILICDDSPSFAAGLKRFLEFDDDLCVVATVSRAEQALRALGRVRPDLVTMDIELPGIDGIEATRRILERHPVPIVVVSAHTSRGSEKTAEALAAGALDVVAKSAVRLDAINGPGAAAIRRRLRRLADAHPGRPARSPAWVGTALPAEPSLSGAAADRGRPAVIVIGASTGGPGALLQILSMLPGDYWPPVLVVQHMATGFTAGMASWLDQQVPLPVALAEHEMPLRRGIWFAPDDIHLRLAPSMRTLLDAVTDVGVHRPAADVLLCSAAEATGAGAVGVVLTGMGRDGAEGIAAIRAAGGLTIAQDEESSIVWGMPRAAIERGAELVLAPAGIGGVLTGLAQRRT